MSKEIIKPGQKIAKPKRKPRIITADHPNFLLIMLGEKVRVISSGEVGTVESYRGRYVDRKAQNVSILVKFTDRQGWFSMADLEFPETITIP